MGTLPVMAFRNLNRQKKRNFLLGGAIAFGILIVTIIDGFAGSFQANIAANMAQLYAGHVFVEGVEKTTKGKAVTIIRDDSAIMAAVADAGIDPTDIAKRSQMDGTLVFQGKKAMQTIYGTDLSNERFLRERLTLKKGSWDNMNDPQALILSEGVAKKLNVEVGDRMLVQLKTATGQNNVGEFILAGISQDMGIFSAILAYAHRAYVNELLDIAPSDYQLFGILVRDLSKTEAMAASLGEELKKRAQVFELTEEERQKAKSNDAILSRYEKLARKAKKESWEGTKYRVFTINDKLSQIEEVVSVLNRVSVIILIVLFFIIMVGILNTFRMVMYERYKEIGTMRAVGMQRGEVRSLFLLEALFLAVGGTLGGWILAFLAMTGLSFIDIGMDTFFALFLKNGHLSFTPQGIQMGFDFILVLGLTLLAAVWPASAASELSPAEALRSAK